MKTKSKKIIIHSLLLSLCVAPVLYLATQIHYPSPLLIRQLVLIGIEYLLIYVDIRIGMRLYAAGGIIEVLKGWKTYLVILVGGGMVAQSIFFTAYQILGIS